MTPGRLSWCSLMLTALMLNCSLNSDDKYNSFGITRKNLCLALLEIQIKPIQQDWTFIVFKCSKACSAHLWRERVSPSQNRNVTCLTLDGWLAWRAYMSAMYQGQRFLYLINPLKKKYGKKNLLSASPASRWRVRSAFPDAKTKNKMVWTQCMQFNIDLRWHWWTSFLPSLSAGKQHFLWSKLVEVVIGNLDTLWSVFLCSYWSAAILYFSCDIQAHCPES